MHALAFLGLFVFTQDPVPPVAPQKSIWDRLSFYADGRMRSEHTFDQPNGEDRHRGRMRFRVGGVYEMEEDLRFEARMSSAAPGGDANNPHWDMGDGPEGFSGAELVLDRFFLEWNGCPQWKLRTGKMPHAFTSPPVFGELVWDADVHPAGFAAIWSSSASNAGPKYDVRAVEYIAVENGAADDASMFGMQANLQADTSGATKVQAAVSYSAWASLDSNAGVFGNQGNTNVAGDFGIWEGFVAGTLEGGPLGKSTVFVQAMHNAEDDDDEEDGLALGAQLGKSGKKGNTNVFAAWYELDANSIFSPVAQDDTPITGSGIGDGMEGVIFGGQYFLTDNFSIRIWGLSSDADAAEDPFRARLDLDFKIK